MDCCTRKGEKVKGVRIWDKKIVIVKLIILKKQGRLRKKSSYNEKFSQFGKNSGLIPLASSSGIGAWYSGLCGEGCCPSAWLGDD
jgi:hypothetical protein